MEIREILNLLEGLEEGRRLYRQEGSLEKWIQDAESAGHRVVHHDGRQDPNSTHHAINRDGKIVGKFFNATYVNNKRGFLHTEGVAEGSEEQVYKVVAVDKSNALKKPTKLNVKASSIEDVFSRLAANDWYALSINGVEVIAGKRLKQGVAEGILGDREYNRVMPVVKRIAGEVSDYDRDEFGEELWSLLDQKYGSKFAQSVLADLDVYWDTYTELTGQQDVIEEQQTDEDPVARVERLAREIQTR